MLNRLQGVFKSFQRHDGKYVVIGGIAAILHGVPRATFDLDILIEATPDNAETHGGGPNQSKRWRQSYAHRGI